MDGNLLTALYVTPENFGAKGDGSTDDTAAIQAADAWSRAHGSCQVAFGAKVYMTTGLTIYTGSNWIGVGAVPQPSGADDSSFTPPINGTIIRLLPNSLPSAVIEGLNSTANWSAIETAPPDPWVEGCAIRGLCVDGNWNGGANNTSGDGIAIYGTKLRLDNLYICNVAGNGIRTAFTVGPNSPGAGNSPGYGTWGMEPYYSQIRIDTCGQHGWWDAGPHDGLASDVIITDVSMSQQDSYDGLYITEGASERWARVHCWSRHSSAGWRTPMCRYGVNVSGGYATFSNSYFEGGHVNIANFYQCIVATDDTCIFAGAWQNHPAIVISGSTSQIILRGQVGAPCGASGMQNSVGLSLGPNSGDNVFGLDIAMQVNNQEGGNAVFGPGYKGLSKVRLQCWNNTTVQPISVNSSASFSGGKFSFNQVTWQPYQSVGLASGSGLALTSGTPRLILSTPTLSPGTWRISGLAGIQFNSTSTVTQASGYIGTGGAFPSSPATRGLQAQVVPNVSISGGFGIVLGIPGEVLVISQPTTVDLWVVASFTGGSVVGFGNIQASRDEY